MKVNPSDKSHFSRVEVAKESGKAFSIAKGALPSRERKRKPSNPKEFLKRSYTVLAKTPRGGEDHIQAFFASVLARSMKGG